MSAPARWWTHGPDGRIVCELCPRLCRLRDGQRGFCFTRRREGDRLLLDDYGRSTGFCVDPLEKKPLFHFLPGEPVLSFGTAGCNLGCRFCQNWEIAHSQALAQELDRAEPERIAEAAVALGCAAVAFTYNDPVPWAEYAIDTAIACRARGIRTVAVTAGYVCEAPRRELFAAIDAANVDLKGFSDRFYRHETLSGRGGLHHVLRTLEDLKHRSATWLEITTLLIPGLNDRSDELERLASWIHDALGPDVPLHFTAFHPDYRMQDRPATPPETLQRARRIARDRGLVFIYTGNVDDPAGQATRCPRCDALLIERSGYRITRYRLGRSATCPSCASSIPGVFRSQPGTWGSRRLPVRLDPAPRSRSGQAPSN